jgi:hypothetical protein
MQRQSLFARWQSVATAARMVRKTPMIASRSAQQSIVFTTAGLRPAGQWILNRDFRVQAASVDGKLLSVQIVLMH